MIHLQMKGLIGNNLFQYAFARILSEDLGYALEVTHSPYKAKNNVPQLVELLSHFHDAPLRLPGKSFDAPVDRTAVIGHNGFDGHRIHLDAIRGLPEDRRIEVAGFFERYEIFRADKERIRQWYAVDPIDLGYDVSEDDLVAHVRRGDFLVFGRALSLDFYRSVLDELDFRRLFVCGFGLDREVRKTFRKYKPTYVHRTPSEDFRFIKGFRRIIQSQSTFAWWAGFLSEAEEIYAPIPEPFSTPFECAWPQIDLRVDDESRYRYIENVPHRQKSFSLKDVITARSQLPQESLRSSLDELRQRYRNRIRSRWEQIRAFSPRQRMAGNASWLRDWTAWELRYKRRRYRRGRYRFDRPADPARRVLGGYERVLVIRMNHSYAGFFAIFTFALNQILFCERNGCLPVVQFGRWSSDGPNAYYDEAHGPNVWDYYFEPVAGYSYQQIEELVRDPGHPLQASDVVTLTDEDLWYLHCFEKRSIFAYTYERYRLKTGFDAGWYDRQRRRAHAVIEKYVRLKKPILDAVDAFHRRHMQGRHVLGMHLRGTDKGVAAGSERTKRKVEPEVYFPHVDRHLARHPAARLFVATDQVQYLQKIGARYGDRVLAANCSRSTDSTAPFRHSEGSPFRKGLEVLVDVLLLSRCQFFLKCASHVGEAALWLNPDLPSRDLN